MQQLPSLLTSWFCGTATTLEWRPSMQQTEPDRYVGRSPQADAEKMARSYLDDAEQFPRVCQDCGKTFIGHAKRAFCKACKSVETRD